MSSLRRAPVYDPRQFAFLNPESPDLQDAASKVEALAYPNYEPRYEHFTIDLSHGAAKAILR